MEYKTLANRSKEGSSLYLFISILLFVVTLIVIFIGIFNFNWILIILLIFLFILASIFLSLYIVIKKSNIELLKYNEKYLVIKNELIKWNDIKSFKAIYLTRNLFGFKYGSLIIELKNNKRIMVYRVEKIDDTFRKLNELKNKVYWKR